MSAEPADPYQWLRELEHSYQRRLTRYERQIERRYGTEIWTLLATAHTSQHDPRDWCWLPIGAAYDTAQTHSTAPVPVLHGSVLAALSSWRQHGRCTVLPHDTWQPSLDPTSTPVETVLHDLITTLPERCVYLATPTASGVLGATGVFVHLEWDADIQRAQIRLLLDVATDRTDMNQLIPQPLDVEPGHRVTEALVLTWQRTHNRIELLQDQTPGWTDADSERAHQQSQHVAPQLAVARALGDPEQTHLAPLAHVLAEPTTAHAAQEYHHNSGSPDTPQHLTLATPRS